MYGNTKLFLSHNPSQDKKILIPRLNQISEQSDFLNGQIGFQLRTLTSSTYRAQL